MRRYYSVGSRRYRQRQRRLWSLVHDRPPPRNFNKRGALDCGKARCGICHQDKLRYFGWNPQRSNWRSWERYRHELTQEGLAGRRWGQKRPR